MMMSPEALAASSSCNCVSSRLKEEGRSESASSCSLEGAAADSECELLLPAASSASAAASEAARLFGSSFRMAAAGWLLTMARVKASARSDRRETRRAEAKFRDEEGEESEEEEEEEEELREQPANEAKLLSGTILEEE
mmetsp:Transcript_37836/g.81928  ORF Transcript_37836/g.81928 Transcript_37836/m.81928 type:complete len:139 (+) Transcript_37836:1037-1453(+)